MSVPSDSSGKICCPSQARMVMIPSSQRPSNIFPLNFRRTGNNYKIKTPLPYRIIRYSSPAQYQQIMRAHGINTNLHGNENNTNVKLAKNSLPTRDANTVEPKSSAEERNEDPLDLSSTNLNSFSSSSKISVSTGDNESNSEAGKSPECIVLKSPKKEPVTPPSSQAEEQEEILPEREITSDELLIQERELEGWVGHVKPVPGIPRQAGNKREEVLKAAKSLFSKRTRTLYHWLYPGTSKTKLKATVAAAWETLSAPEKDFYISQVLGRFGVPAGSLMVNPQLGGFKGVSGGSSVFDSSSNSTGLLFDETGHAVTNLLLSEDNVPWMSYPQTQTQERATRKRKRQPKNTNGESSHGRQRQTEEETRILKQMRDESVEDDFADDPELSKEFEQFRWALHVSNSQGK